MGIIFSLITWFLLVPRHMTLAGPPTTRVCCFWGSVASASRGLSIASILELLLLLFPWTLIISPPPCLPRPSSSISSLLCSVRGMHSGTLPSSSASTAPTLPSLTHQGSVPPASSYLWTAWSAILPIATSATIRWFLSTSLVSPATNCSTTAPPATALNAVHASTLHTS